MCQKLSDLVKVFEIYKQKYELALFLAQAVYLFMHSEVQTTLYSDPYFWYNSGDKLLTRWFSFVLSVHFFAYITDWFLTTTETTEAEPIEESWYNVSSFLNRKQKLAQHLISFHARYNIVGLLVNNIVYALIVILAESQTSASYITAIALPRCFIVESCDKRIPSYDHRHHHSHHHHSHNCGVRRP